MNQQILDLQTKAIDQMKSMHEQALTMNERLADTMVNMMPDVPAPFAEYMPKPAEMMVNYLDFLGQVGDANREFAKALMNAWTPAPSAPAKKK